MIFGLGIDLVDLAKFKRLVKVTGKDFLNLTFTKNEKLRAKSKNGIQSLAGIFSAKEAIFKSLNLSKKEIKDFNYFQEIEIIHLPSEKPEVKFLGSLSKKFPKQKFKIFISISYSSKIAIAIAILEKIK